MKTQMKRLLKGFKEFIICKKKLLQSNKIKYGYYWRLLWKQNLKDETGQTSRERITY